MSGRKKNRRLIGKSEMPQKYLIGGLNEQFFLLDNLEDDQPVMLLHADYPVRSEKLFCVHIVQGVLEISVGLSTYEIHENQLFFLLPGSVFQTIRVSSDLKFFWLYNVCRNDRQTFYECRFPTFKDRSHFSFLYWT